MGTVADAASGSSTVKCFCVEMNLSTIHVPPVVDKILWSGQELMIVIQIMKTLKVFWHTCLHRRQCR